MRHSEFEFYSLKCEVDCLRSQYLNLLREYENFKDRVLKDRAEVWSSINELRTDQS